MLDSASKYKSNMPTCSICKFQYDAYYRIPRVIPKCGHTFCQKCINLSLQVKGNRKIFTCPDCQSQTVIRKSAAQDVPKNIGIMDIAKNLKKRQFQQSSPFRLKSPAKDSPSKLKIFCTLHPNKQLDMVCQTCNFQKVCSICALISNTHSQHKFVQFVPASKFDLNEVKQVFTIIQDTVKMTILPNASQNIIKKTQQNLVNQLTASVKEHFKQNYYKVIEKKQNEVISQVKEIKFEGGISKKIEQIAKSYDMLKIQYSDIFKKSLENHNTALEIVEDFIQKCKNLHNQVEIFSQHAQTRMKSLFKQISTKINQSVYFRFTQMPFSLKNLLTQQIEVTSPAKYKSEMRNSQIKKGSLDFGMKTSARGQRSNSKRQDDLKSLQNMSFDAQKKPFTAGTINAKKSGFMPPKQKINKSEAKFQKNDEDMIPILHIESKVQQKKNLNSSLKFSSNTERLNKSSIQNIKQAKKSVQKEKTSHQKLNYSSITRNQPQTQDSSSPILPQNQLKLKQVRPTKEIPLNIKAKFSAITKEITRQQNSQSLELIGMQINDALIIYVCEYLKSKKLKFAMIKLVKNNLTDEGLSILLGYLANDDTTQVLNLTSNQLTSKSLDLFIEVGMKNSLLKTIYLSHNKIASLAIKQRANEFSNFGIELIV